MIRYKFIVVLPGRRVKAVRGRIVHRAREMARASTRPRRLGNACVPFYQLVTAYQGMHI